MISASSISLSIAHLAIPGLFLTAGIYDVLTTRIPDWISLAIIALFGIFFYFTGLPLSDAIWHFASGILVFFLGFIAFYFGWMGGGDGKLAAVGALWLGPALAPQFLTLACFYGAGMVLIMFVLRRIPLPAALLRQNWFAPWLSGQDGLPFGLAMAASMLTLIRPESIAFSF